ncbi:hypothetical protein [Ferroplasma sp.]|uniref:hypothetical protein n=1 Tax=Ferroplasma sp. TaxID=2591003 RepID=UPI0026293C29|nr:hypothetical protein [Ferroplasma sp.]
MRTTYKITTKNILKYFGLGVTVDLIVMAFISIIVAPAHTTNQILLGAMLWLFAAVLTIVRDVSCLWNFLTHDKDVNITIDDIEEILLYSRNNNTRIIHFNDIEGIIIYTGASRLGTSYIHYYMLVLTNRQDSLFISPILINRLEKKFRNKPYKNLIHGWGIIKTEGKTGDELFDENIENNM